MRWNTRKEVAPQKTSMDGYNRLYIVGLLRQKLKRMEGTLEETSTAESAPEKDTKRKRASKTKKKKKEVVVDRVEDGQTQEEEEV